MDEKIPLHIHRLIQELQQSVSAENTLLSNSHLLTQDTTLMHIYLQLGYCLNTNSFFSGPSTSHALSLFSSEYGLPLQASVDSYFTQGKANDLDAPLKQEMLRTFYEQGISEITSGADLGLEPAEEASLSMMWDLFTPQTKAEFSTPKPRKVRPSPSTQATMYFTPNSLNSTPFSEDSDFGTPRCFRGLKHLTTLVKHIVCKRQPTSFKEVAVNLIDELIVTEGAERIKEEKNVRRRVYDAMNVLIAAGVLERDGKSVTWKDEWDAVEIEEIRVELEKKRRKVDEKREKFKEVLNKYLAIQHLMNRNAQGKLTPAVHFPFIAVSTEDSSKNSMSIKVNKTCSNLQLKVKKPISMFGDMDVLLALNMHKIRMPLLRHYLPSTELIRYCSSPVEF